MPGDYFSLRWTGWIKPPLPGKYVIKTSSDVSIRVRINNQLIIDHWDRGAGDEQAEVELTDQLQPFSVEYNDYTANAGVCLRWSLLRRFSPTFWLGDSSRANVGPLQSVRFDRGKIISTASPRP